MKGHPVLFTSTNRRYMQVLFKGKGTGNRYFSLGIATLRIRREMNVIRFACLVFIFKISIPIFFILLLEMT